MSSNTSTQGFPTVKVAAAVVILVAGALAFLYWKTILTRSIAGLISAMTQTPVSLNLATLDLGTKKGSLLGLKVGNPNGFHTDSAFKAKEISLTFGNEDHGEAIHILEILIEAPEITFEAGENGSNFDVIQSNINDFVQSNEGDGKSAKSETQKISRDTLLIIDHLRIRNGQAYLSASAAEGEAVRSSLPEIHLRDIGKRQGGATPGEVAQEVVNALKIALIKKALAKDLKGLQDSARNALENTSEVVGDTLQKGAEGLADSLNNVFGKQ